MILAICSIFLVVVLLDLPFFTHGLSSLNNNGRAAAAAAVGGEKQQQGPSRREFFDTVSKTSIAAGVAAAAGVFQLFPQPAFAASSSEEKVLLGGSSSSLPFCVIGANGKTGTRCVQGLMERNIPVRATSRTGVYNGQQLLLQQDAQAPAEQGGGGATKISAAAALLSPMVCDVTDPTTIEPAIQGVQAVIFAASASKAGGTPSQVDNDGLVAVAKACLANKVPHLVIVSSGSVSKPKSPVYKFLNLFGNIMDEKIKGEDAVRDLYRTAAAAEGGGGGGTCTCTYTVIRPGGLTEDPPRGVFALELNQGDDKSGRISRTDVASLCIESVFYPKSTAGTTFECYDADTGKPLQSVGFSNILKQKNSADDPVAKFVTGRECRGTSWEQIFSGLVEKDNV